MTTRIEFYLWDSLTITDTSASIPLDSGGRLEITDTDSSADLVWYTGHSRIELISIREAWGMSHTMSREELVAQCNRHIPPTVTFDGLPIKAIIFEKSK